MIDDLRDFIRSTLEAEEASMPDKMKKPNTDLPELSTVPGAGIVVVRQFDDGWRVLGLILGDFIDIPKGVIEDGEKPFQAALRETLEESGIDQLNFAWGTQSAMVGRLTTYVASTTQDPKIDQNPETGIYEHQGFAWLSWEEMLNDAYPYLRPVIGWARDIVEGLQSFPD